MSKPCQSGLTKTIIGLILFLTFASGVLAFPTASGSTTLETVMMMRDVASATTYTRLPAIASTIPSFTAKATNSTTGSTNTSSTAPEPASSVHEIATKTAITCCSDTITKPAEKDVHTRTSTVFTSTVSSPKERTASTSTPCTCATFTISLAEALPGFDFSRLIEAIESVKPASPTNLQVIGPYVGPTLAYLAEGVVLLIILFAGLKDLFPALQHFNKANCPHQVPNQTTRAVKSRPGQSATLRRRRPQRLPRRVTTTKSLPLSKT